MTDKGSRKSVLGITGGIATGKSTVATYLSQAKGVPILDADVLARDVVGPGSPVLQAIQSRFGTDMIQANGELNRAALGDIIFNDLDARRWLEAQIHPLVRSQLLDQAQALPNQYRHVVMVIPLLFEAAMVDLVDQIWVVATDESRQLARLMARNALTLAQAQARIASQMPLAEKIKQADVVLDNNGTYEELVSQIDSAWLRFSCPCQS